MWKIYLIYILTLIDGNNLIDLQSYQAYQNHTIIGKQLTKSDSSPKMQVQWHICFIKLLFPMFNKIMI